MKLWLLKAREDLPKDNDPWEPWYDTAAGFVIRAETETAARAIATRNAGNEIGMRWRQHKWHAWADPTYSTCEELTADGDADVVLCDFKSA